MQLTLEELKRIRWNQYRQAVVIGWWRMGAPVFIIAAIEAIEHYQVEEIISDYQSSNQK